jgi:DNA-binding NtrC family response regulator
LGTSPRAQGTGGVAASPPARQIADSAVAHRLRSPGVMNVMAQPTHGSLELSGRPLGYHGAVCDFKRRLIEATLHQMRGNRTHTARALGLQRTYLLRLMRELRVTAPPPPVRPRRPLAG